ncbi:hypothetical protein SCALM49S_03625 [Streptomyces californicus]
MAAKICSGSGVQSAGRASRRRCPCTWTPLPVQIFAATDRGSLFTGAALAVVLMTTTLLVLAAVSRIRTRASYR